MNSLYGKMLQGMCDESSAFFNENEYKEFLEWYNDNEMTSWRGFDNGLFVSGSAKEKIKPVEKNIS